MTTLDQMAKAAYEAVADRLAQRGALWEPWGNLPERIHEDWRAAIRAALALLDDHSEVLDRKPAEVKPDAVTGE